MLCLDSVFLDKLSLAQTLLLLKHFMYLHAKPGALSGENYFLLFCFSCNFEWHFSIASLSILLAQCYMHQ